MNLEKIRSKVLTLLYKNIGDYNPEVVFWIEDSNNANCDLSYKDLCAKCAAKYLIDEPNKNLIICGGYGDTQETDVPLYCDECGKQLQYYLLEGGVEDECEHFLYDDTIIDISNKCEVYALLRVLDRSLDPDDYERNYLVDKVTLKIYDTINKTNYLSQLVMAHGI